MSDAKLARLTNIERIGDIASFVILLGSWINFAITRNDIEPRQK
jgi:hypothetical protein